MKTRIAILMMVLGVFMSTSALALEPVPDSKAVSRSVASYLEDNLEYPLFAKEKGLECCVVVEITIQQNGSFKVTGCNCVSKKMKEAVTESIENLHKKSDFFAPYAGQKVYLKIIFDLL